MAVGAPRDDACQIPSTNQNFGRSPPLHRRAPNVSRVGGIGLPQRMSRALPECSAVACPTPSRTLSPTMQNDERQVSLESILGSGFSCYSAAQIHDTARYTQEEVSQNEHCPPGAAKDPAKGWSVWGN